MGKVRPAVWANSGGRRITFSNSRATDNGSEASRIHWLGNRTPSRARLERPDRGAEVADSLAFTIHHSLALPYLTTSTRNPFRYSVSGIIGMMGWSGDCERTAIRRRIFRAS